MFQWWNRSEETVVNDYDRVSEFTIPLGTATSAYGRAPENARNRMLNPLKAIEDSYNRAPE